VILAHSLNFGHVDDLVDMLKGNVVDVVVVIVGSPDTFESYASPLTLIMLIYRACLGEFMV